MGLSAAGGQEKAEWSERRRGKQRITKSKKQWKQSEGVVENKGHHFFKCCELCAFCVQINTDFTPKGAKNAAFCANEPKAHSARRGQGSDK